MMGETLEEVGFTEEAVPEHISVKKSVFPFSRFPGADIILGPEMKSTGEVMGIDRDYGAAFAKAHAAESRDLPREGTVFVSVKDSDKRDTIFVVKKLVDMGFNIVATAGTGKVLRRNGVPVKILNKIAEGRPNVLDMIKNGNVHLVINTPSGKNPRADEARIRYLTVTYQIPCATTTSGAQAAVNGIESLLRETLEVCPLQDYHKKE
jgi:carbamoyl-phosphate synthase large subunit